MKRQIIIILALILVPVLMFAAAPVVSNVQVAQRTDGSMLVDITYDLADSDGDDVEITVECSNDGGTTWDYAITGVTGDVGAGVSPGTGKAIVWDFAEEHPDEYDTDYVIRVTAEDGNPAVPEMIFVPAGTFQMGRTGVATPIHTVRLDPFYIGKFEVTQQEWVDIMGSNPSWFTGDMQRPVEHITWLEAVAYCNYLSTSEGLTPVYSVAGDTNPANWPGIDVPDADWSADGYRLPTEAEWEYSARGATGSPDYLYAGSDTIGDVAWYYYNSNTGSGL